MAHGTPDWGVVSAAQTIFPVSDLGELAARLGSPVTHDRRGDVIWWDDFECGLVSWQSTLGGTGAAAAVSTDRARNGKRSAKLTPGSDGDLIASIRHFQPYPSVSRLGIEASLSLAGAVDYIEGALGFYNGSNIYFFVLRYNAVAGQLEYVDAAGVYQAITTIPAPYVNPTLFHVLKGVVDLENAQYARVMIDDTEISLAGIPGYDLGATTERYLELQLTVHGLSGAPQAVYFDDVILTQNEPA